MIYNLKANLHIIYVDSECKNETETEQVSIATAKLTRLFSLISISSSS